jgi:peptidoglycan-associated lipoprotein
MNSKILRSSRVAFVLVISLLLWAGCTPQAPVQPWSSQVLSRIQFSFTDTDLESGEIGGDVLLKLNDAALPQGIGYYVLRWSSTASDSGKGDVVAEVPVGIEGDLLYTVRENTKIPASKNRYFLLYLKDATGKEVYSGLNARVADEAEETVAQKDSAIGSAADGKTETVAAGRTGIDAAGKQIRVPKTAAEKEAAAYRLTVINEITVENVLFEYDRSYLKSEFKRKLNNAFASAERLDLIKIVISGHADERGSNEYNLALGERRAFNVKRYLISLGLQEENITVISYGEEKPVDPRHSEGAWAKNRRSETDLKE